MLFKIHKNTVRAWLKSGLKPIDDRRPVLIQGRQLSSFLHGWRNRARERCKPGQFYCMRCRAARTSALGQAKYRPITSASGNLHGTCSYCGARMCRRVSLVKLPSVAGDLQVQLPQAEQRIEDGPSPRLNSDLRQDPDAYANAQSGK